MEKQYFIKYRHCGEVWSSVWSCACNDECPVCGKEIEPYDYSELDPNEDIGEL